MLSGPAPCLNLLPESSCPLGRQGAECAVITDRAQAKLLPTCPHVGPWDGNSPMLLGTSQHFLRWEGTRSNFVPACLALSSSLLSCKASISISGANPGRWRKESPRGKIFPNPLASPRSWPLSCPETEKSVSPLWLQGWHPSARIHGPSGPSCAAASLRFYGNTPLSSHWDIIFLLPIFNNLQLKGSCKDIELVTAYFQHRFVLLVDFPALHTAQLLSQALAAAASPAWPCLLHPQRGGVAPAGHKLGFPLSYFIAWAHCRSFPHWLHAGFHLWLHQTHTAGFPQPGNP